MWLVVQLPFGYEPKYRHQVQSRAFRRLELLAVELQDEDVPDVQGIVGCGQRRSRGGLGEGAASARGDCAQPQRLAVDARGDVQGCEGSVGDIENVPQDSRHGEPTVAQREVLGVQVYSILRQQSRNGVREARDGYEERGV
ncbi:hypothetical protein ON010_g11955 [Phytophthora cinnamomi]|nr:hypothetical protein ON010_g11955 [Phytophthora cinnamomi]